MIGLIFSFFGCDMLEDEQVKEEVHGLKVEVEIPHEKLVQTEEVDIRTIEENITLEKAVLTLYEENGSQMDEIEEDIDTGDEELKVMFEEIPAGVEYDIDVDLNGTIREEAEIKTLYKGNKDGILAEEDTVVDVEINTEPLITKSLEVKITGDYGMVDKIKLEHPDEGIEVTKDYEGSSIVFEDGEEYENEEITLIPSIWHLTVNSGEEQKKVKTPLLLPTEEKVVVLEVDIEGEGNLDMNINISTSPEAPENIEINEQDELVWDEVAGAETYTVYKTVKNDEEVTNTPEKAYIVDDTSFKNLEPDYYYWVRAYVDSYSSGLSKPIFYETEDTLKPVEEWVFEGHTLDVWEVTIDQDRYIYSGGGDNTLRKINPEGKEEFVFEGHSSSVWGVAVDSDGYIYGGSFLYGNVSKISPEGEKVWMFEEHNDSVRDLAVFGNEYIYSGSSDETVRKISTEGEEEWTFAGHNSDVYAVTVAEDGYIFSGSRDETVRKINPDGEEIWKFDGHHSNIYDIAVDGDGYVYSGSGGNDKTVRKINPEGEEEWVFEGHNDSIWGIAVNEDGYVYSGCNEGTLRKINPEGEEIWKFDGHSERVTSVAVDENDNVYSGSWDETVRKIVQN